MREVEAVKSQFKSKKDIRIAYTEEVRSTGYCLYSHDLVDFSNIFSTESSSQSTNSSYIIFLPTDRGYKAV